MAWFSVFCLIASSVMVLVTFTKALGGMRAGDMHSHLQWALWCVLTVLAANVMAIVHARQSDRIIRDLRRRLPADDPESTNGDAA